MSGKSVASIMGQLSTGRVTLIAVVVVCATAMAAIGELSSDVISAIYTTVIAYSFGYINGKKVTGQSET